MTGRHVEQTLRPLLSERELQVLRLAARGLTDVQIAAEMFVSRGAVRDYSARTVRKLRASNRVQAVALAYEAGILRPGDAWGAKNTDTTKGST